jgi:hypothetical protein
VTFTNRVLRFQVKVCKIVESGSLTALKSVDGTYNGTVTSHTDGPASWSGLANGTCSGILTSSTQPAGWQVIDGDGDFTTADVIENNNGQHYFISAATVDNTWPGQSTVTINAAGNDVSWHPGIGINVVTITNKWRSGTGQ